MKALRVIGWIVAVSLLVTIWGGCMRWRFNECRAVGHSKLYCLVQK